MQCHLLESCSTKHCATKLRRCFNTRLFSCIKSSNPWSWIAPSLNWPFVAFSQKVTQMGKQLNRRIQSSKQFLFCKFATITATSFILNMVINKTETYLSHYELQNCDLENVKVQYKWWPCLCIYLFKIWFQKQEIKRQTPYPDPHVTGPFQRRRANIILWLWLYNNYNYIMFYIVYILSLTSCLMVAYCGTSFNSIIVIRIGFDFHHFIIN